MAEPREKSLIEGDNVEIFEQKPEESEQEFENDDTEHDENEIFGILAIFFGGIGVFLGLIFGIIGLCIYKEPYNKRKCHIGIGLFASWVVILILLRNIIFANLASYF